MAINRTPANPANAGGKPSADNANAPADDTKARLEAAERRALDAENRYKNLHSRFGAMSQEVGVLRKQVGMRGGGVDDYEDGESGYGYEEEAPRQRPQRTSAADDPVTQELLREQDFIKFRLDNPDWQKYWNDILNVVDPNAPGFDPFLAKKVVSFRQNAPGVPDYYATYENALMRLKWREREAADAAAAAAKEAAEIERKERAVQIRGQAMSSGSEASAPTGDIDLSTIRTSRELLEKIPELIDQSNPPSGFRRR